MQRSLDRIQETDHVASAAADRVRETGKIVQDEVESLKEIAERTGVTQEIFGQTCLFALNATVVSARAGEHGKGLASSQLRYANRPSAVGLSPLRDIVHRRSLSVGQA
ncbi:MAG: methyl-accepting chemotaxis protein [Paracoccaceae bacterium]